MRYLCLTCGAPQRVRDSRCRRCGSDGTRRIHEGELLGHNGDELLLDCVVEALREAALVAHAGEHRTGWPGVHQRRLVVERRLRAQTELLRLRIAELEGQGRPVSRRAR